MNSSTKRLLTQIINTYPNYSIYIKEKKCVITGDGNTLSYIYVEGRGWQPSSSSSIIVESPPSLPPPPSSPPPSSPKQTSFSSSLVTSSLLEQKIDEIYSFVRAEKYNREQALKRIEEERSMIEEERSMIEEERSRVEFERDQLLMMKPSTRLAESVHDFWKYHDKVVLTLDRNENFPKLPVSLVSDQSELSSDALNRYEKSLKETVSASNKTILAVKESIRRNSDEAIIKQHNDALYVAGMAVAKLHNLSVQRGIHPQKHFTATALKYYNYCNIVNNPKVLYVKCSTSTFQVINNAIFNKLLEGIKAGTSQQQRRDVFESEDEDEDEDDEYENEDEDEVRQMRPKKRLRKRSDRQ